MRSAAVVRLGNRRFHTEVKVAENDFTNVTTWSKGNLVKVERKDR